MTEDAIRLCELKLRAVEDLANLPYSYYSHAV